MAVVTPAFLQTKKYSASALRALMLDVPIQNGVTNAGDLLASQRGAGANMSIDVAAGSLWLKGTSSTRQGFYDIYNDATVNLAIGANGSGAGTYRIDQLVAHVYDSVDGGAAQDIGALEIVAGTSSNAFGSPTLALNARTGVGVVPANAIVLADIAVVGGAASITNAAIRDRRPWGRGAFVRKLGGGGGNYLYSNTGFATLDGTNLIARVECSGVPLRMTFRCRMSHSIAGGQSVFGFNVDGVQFANAGSAWETSWIEPSASAGFSVVSAVDWPAPTPGSRVLSVTSAVGSGTATVLNNATEQPEFIIEEIIRQNSANNPAGYA